MKYSIASILIVQIGLAIAFPSSQHSTNGDRIVDCSKFKVDSNGECNKNCYQIYEPVCGQFVLGSSVDQMLRKVFGNDCEFCSAKCEAEKEGKILEQKQLTECPVFKVNDNKKDKVNCARYSQDSDGCNNVCAKNFAPVCGRFILGNYVDAMLHKQYANECEFCNAKCEARKEGKILEEVDLTECPVQKPTFKVESQQSTNGDRIVDCSKFKSGPNGECNKNCYQVYEPVCGQIALGNSFDQMIRRVFGNDCEFCSAKCEAEKEGKKVDQLDLTECPVFKLKAIEEDMVDCNKFNSENSDVCNHVCPKNFEPVCGHFSLGKPINNMFYKNYSNPCVFCAAQCDAKKDGVTLMQAKKSMCAAL